MPSQTFNFADSWQHFVVPAGVEALELDLRGADSPSAGGGHVTGRLVVKPGQDYWIVTGERGQVNSGSTGGGASWGGGGRGGNARGTGLSGGDGGGGATYIRQDTQDGRIIAVAGGAGGGSADGGTGGRGGAATGGAGGTGTNGPNSVTHATGGTPNQGGRGGETPAGEAFSGLNADNTALTRGGRGGDVPSGSTGRGGGGGGGGWRAGGGGVANASGYSPGGGGGGGSNFVGALTGWTNVQGGATAASPSDRDGKVTISWATPAAEEHGPNVPTDVKVNGQAESGNDPVITQAKSKVDIEAVLDDPDDNRVRLCAVVSVHSNFSATRREVCSDLVDPKKDTAPKASGKATVEIDDLRQDTLYYVRLWAVDNTGRRSINYNTVKFWTNRSPKPPTLTAPGDNAQLDKEDLTETVHFAWTHNDPDEPGDPQSDFDLQYWRSGTATEPPGPRTMLVCCDPTNQQEEAGWERRSPAGKQTENFWDIDKDKFAGSTWYEWRVRTYDKAGKQGEWSDTRSFYMAAGTAAPIPLRPINGKAVFTDVPTLFTWQFRDPNSSAEQESADIRYRVAGTTDWTTVVGDPFGVPADEMEWEFLPDTFIPNERYEWQVRTYETGSPGASDWSTSAFFNTALTPGWAVDEVPVIDPDVIEGQLGCGEYRVFLFERPRFNKDGTYHERLIGEVTPIASLTFGRVRDDISGCNVISNGFAADCCDLYANTHCWMHELVVYRDGKRVWEGPITRIAYTATDVEFEAKDCMAYLYRRIMRQGFNDAYRTPVGFPQGGHPDAFTIPQVSVIERSQAIIADALAGRDPVLLPYLTAFQFANDAPQRQVVYDYQKTVWEQLDAFAATAGMDYTTLGRRIILWDTHRAIGRTPELWDGHFSDSLVVTEYGMQLSNYFAVTNGAGVWGAVTPDTNVFPEADPYTRFYGPVEQLASAYGEGAAGQGSTLTPAARQKQEETMREQATRNIAHRWPTPVVVRVPDNTVVDPGAPVTFNQLVPGVWIPLRSSKTCREVAQWQKLDSVTVTVGSGSDEQVSVVMSPAPLAGVDPDATGEAEA